jgi:hypothetical protein
MVIILSVLRLVFPFYDYYIVCPSPHFSLVMPIILSVLRLVFPFYGHYIVCPSPRFSSLWPLYCLSFASFFLFMAIILSVRLTASYYPFGIFNFPQISYNLFK